MLTSLLAWARCLKDNHIGDLRSPDTHVTSLYWKCRADSRLAPSQWEMSLQSNAISHWLGTKPRISPEVYLLCVCPPEACCECAIIEQRKWGLLHVVYIQTLIVLSYGNLATTWGLCHGYCLPGYCDTSIQLKGASCHGNCLQYYIDGQIAWGWANKVSSWDTRTFS